MIRLEGKKHEPLIRYSFKKGSHSGDIYKARYTVCENPICTCCNFDLIFDVKNDQLLSPKFEVSLNLIEKSIAKSTQGDINRRFAKLLIGDFDDRDWRVLAKLFHDKKTFYTENSDLMSVDVSFPIDEIEMNSKLISYHGILPFARPIHFETDDASLLVEDLHCVQPFCNCHDVHLFFTPYGEDRILLPFRSESSEEIYIVYNIKKNRWNLEEQIGTSTNPMHLMTAFREAHDIQRIYRNRYETIRRLYKNYRHRNNMARLSSKAINIGRNDPCPCGSGKKYKKCCMLA